MGKCGYLYRVDDYPFMESHHDGPLHTLTGILYSYPRRNEKRLRDLTSSSILSLRRWIPIRQFRKKQGLTAISIVYVVRNGDRHLRQALNSHWWYTV
jgi:hypothetical protein